MIEVIRRAVRDRQRPLREPLRVPYGVQHLVAQRPRPPRRSSTRPDVGSGPTTRGASYVEQLVFEALAATSRTDDPAPRSSGSARAGIPMVREALERMWPVLTPAELLNDLLRLAGRCSARRRRSSSPAPRDGRCWSGARLSRSRPRSVFTHDDVPLLDEALELLGPRPRHKDDGRGPHLRPHRGRRGPGPVPDAAARAGPALAERLDDDRRRHRAVHRRVGARRLGTRCSSTCPTAGRRGCEELTVGYRVPGTRSWTWRPRCSGVAAPQLDPPRRSATSANGPCWCSSTRTSSPTGAVETWSARS